VKRRVRHFGKEEKYNRTYITKAGFFMVFELVFKLTRGKKQKGIYRGQAIAIVDQMFKEARAKL